MKAREHKIRWRCEACGIDAMIEIGEGADALDIMDKIAGAHDRLSPGCTEEYCFAAFVRPEAETKEGAYSLRP